MRLLLCISAFAVMGFGAQAQFFLLSNEKLAQQPANTEADYEMFELLDNLRNARLAVLCTVAGRDRSLFPSEQFQELAYVQFRNFVDMARANNFELPEYTPNLTSYLLTAIEAPSRDVAIGSLYVEFRIAAEDVVESYRKALDAVSVDGKYEDLVNNLDVSRLYRCELLVPLLEVKGAQ